MIKVAVKTEPNCRRILEIEVPQERVAAEFDKQYNSFRAKANIPGFRPGKAPMDIIKQRYAHDIRSDVLDELVYEGLEQAVKQENLQIITKPKISNIELDDGKPLKFRAEIEIRPEITTNEYKGFEVKRTIIEVKNSDVEEYLRGLQNQMAEFVPVERRSHGNDLIVVDLLRKKVGDGQADETKVENVEIDLGSEGVLKEFKEGLAGVGIGELKEIGVTYPEDYHEKALAGNRVDYLVAVREVKERVLPTLDDDFAKRFDDIANLDDLRNKIRAKLEQDAQAKSEQAIRGDIIKHIVSKNQFEVPESLVEDYLKSATENFKRRYKNVDELELRRAYRKIGEDSIRWQLICLEIARKEGIKVEDADRDAWIKHFAGRYQMSVEAAKEAIGKTRKFEEIDDSILENKVLDFLAANVKIT